MHHHGNSILYRDPGTDLTATFKDTEINSQIALPEGIPQGNTTLGY